MTTIVGEGPPIRGATYAPKVFEFFLFFITHLLGVGFLFPHLLGVGFLFPTS